MPYIFAIAQHCRQHYTTHPAVSQSFQFVFLFKYIEVVIFYLVVRQRKYLRTPIVGHNIREFRVELKKSTVLLYCIHEAIKHRLNSGNACHSVQNVLPTVCFPKK